MRKIFMAAFAALERHETVHDGKPKAARPDLVQLIEVRKDFRYAGGTNPGTVVGHRKTDTADDAIPSYLDFSGVPGVFEAVAK